MADVQHKFVDSLGLKLHYLEWGSHADVPLILIHGFLDQAYSWRRFVTSLAHMSHEPLWVIAPDCRGHGESDWVGPGGYYHFPDYVLDLDCIIQTLGVARVRLIGHSMGGSISFLYSGTFPERVDKLALIEGVGPPGLQFWDAPLRMEKWIADVRERGRHHFRQYPSIEAGARQLRQTNPRLSPDWALDLAGTGMKKDASGQWVWKFDPLHRTSAPQPFYTAQALEFLRRIACPVLIVEGKDSHQSLRADKEERFAAISNRRHLIIEDAGHMVHQDNPDQLARAVADFVEY